MRPARFSGLVDPNTTLLFCHSRQMGAASQAFLDDMSNPADMTGAGMGAAGLWGAAPQQQQQQQALPTDIEQQMKLLEQLRQQQQSLQQQMLQLQHQSINQGPVVPPAAPVAPVQPQPAAANQVRLCVSGVLRAYAGTITTFAALGGRVGRFTHNRRDVHMPSSTRWVG